jgi:hypothetical protein
MIIAENAWHLLVMSLPTTSATARMRIWRALKAFGCVALRDGAYLLPGGGEREQALRDLGDECIREGGNAWLMAVVPQSGDDAFAYRQLFDRSADYAGLRKSWKSAQRGLSSLAPAELARLRRRLQRDLDAVRSVDFFPGDATVEAEAAWFEFTTRVDALLTPDEPHETRGRLPRLDVADYQGRVWATRRRLWIDRVASAWLIRRFIDPGARFRWLARPADCPKRALGFDFDGAAFTHVGELVTFETLMASFGLDDDPGLRRLAALVHALDIGGEPVAEARGLEAVMAGARERIDDDDLLLAEMSTVLDSLYAHFLAEAQRGADPRSKESP